MITYDEKYDVVVIGAGLAGLTCGAFLAKGGKLVKVFERNPNPGGLCTTFQRKGFKFDGAAFFCRDVEEGEPVSEILYSLGMANEVEFFKTSRIRYTFPNENIDMPPNVSDSIKMLSEKFPHEKEGIRKFFDTCIEIKNATSRTSISPVISKYRDKSAKQLIDEYLKDTHLKNLIAGIGFIGVMPDRFSAIYEAQALLRRLAPIYSPRGGMQSITDAYTKGLLKYGGQLELGTTITKIITEEGKAKGVITNDGRKIGADYVVSAVAALQTFDELIDKEELDPKFLDSLKNRKLAMSAFLVYLGIDLDLKMFDIADINFVHEASNVEEGYDNCIKGKFDKTWFSLFIPSLFNPTLCPKIHGDNENIIIILTFAPFAMDWEKDKERVTNLMINKAERLVPNLSKHIIVKDSASPLTLVRYTLNTEGSMSGWAPTSEYMSSKKLEQRTPIKNLFLAGQWTQPGARTSQVAISGRNAAEMILHP